ncbi:MAG: (deoxy)nucleoside triphosphate pyrophosphohydrolase [Clostridioides sp.]|jgi:8-oxo-dGTP diphosphatase|nr:(deoxy)nucleoside triphosphate pyrophosphohydrolase [Clostridioides sp.]
MKKTIKVVAAIIENEDSEILCALRSSRMSIPNHWEFAGGKVEIGEDIFHAIEREIQEELNCSVNAIKVFDDSVHEYDDNFVNLISIKCALISGTPTATEHSKLIYLRRENLSSLNWAPADLNAVNKLLDEKM